MKKDQEDEDEDLEKRRRNPEPMYVNADLSIARAQSLKSDLRARELESLGALLHSTLYTTSVYVLKR